MIDVPTKKKPGKEATITPQRKQLILNFVHEYRRIREISPTYLEIAIGIGYATNAEGTAYTLAEQLINEGWLRRVQAGSRSILPVRPQTDVYCEITDAELIAVAERQRNLRILRRL